MYKSLILLISTLLFLQGCSSTQLKVIKAAEFRIQELNSFQIDPLEVNATNGSANQLILKASMLEAKVKDNLIAKGYSSTTNSKPSFRVSLYITALSETILSPGDLNFMKGVKSSNFPVADPRARSYNSDALVLVVRLQQHSPPKMNAACLIPNENQQSQTDYEISYYEAESCLSALLDNIPNRN